MSELLLMKEEIWVFGYGSLIWRPGFEFEESRMARLNGYGRRFCQASHDHRGTAQHPGRVATLLPKEGVHCTGVAFRLGERSERVLVALDEREQDGYQRVAVELDLGVKKVAGITWIASPENPSWRGEESLSEIARVISASHGPSGTNRAYLFELEEALQRLQIHDPHVSELTARVRAIKI